VSLRSVAGRDVIYRKPINIGIAVALDWGLIVPVIKRAEDLSLGGITFNTGASAYTLSGNPVALTGAMTINSAGGVIQTANLAINGTSTSSLAFGTDSSAGNNLTLGANATFNSVSEQLKPASS